MIEIIKLELVNKGSLKAKFNVKMHKWGGLQIRECVLFESENKKWVNLPSRQYEVEGKKKYFAYLGYEDRALDDKLKESILRAAEEYIEKMSTPKRESEKDFEDVPF